MGHRLDTSAVVLCRVLLSTLTAGGGILVPQGPSSLAHEQFRRGHLDPISANYTPSGGGCGRFGPLHMSGALMLPDGNPHNNRCTAKLVGCEKESCGNGKREMQSRMEEVVRSQAEKGGNKRQGWGLLEQRREGLCQEITLPHQRGSFRWWVKGLKGCRLEAKL
ncbi:hypothetical protein DFH07DRAFT_769949 [Mycena maculata]|uniref:Secreted protein n=1 Tax=Mycena maculata TaxID=230809 RepID=A0AAD7NMI1_9AGAR|nr:hypothetical protein DFH07DRAFT_769949 [Mycena maculata]